MKIRGLTIPVTILTGFLGSGKTTLLNHIIKSRPEKKFAIIENEFGEIPIDNELVVTNEEDLFTLKNGCICCSLQSDILDILIRLAARKQPIDHVLIESTGVADPAPVAQLFMNNMQLQQYYRLDGVVCLVDAVNFQHQVKEQPETVKQLVMADLIVINKTDKAAEEEVSILEKKLNSLNRTAKIVRSSQAHVPTHQLLSLQAYDLAAVENSLLVITESSPACAPFKNPSAQRLPNQPHHAIQTFSMKFSAPVNLIKFNKWFSDLISSQGHKLYRSKGIIHTSTSDHRLIFQSVHHEIDGIKGSKWGATKRENRLVFIGKELDEGAIREEILECLA